MCIIIKNITGKPLSETIAKRCVEINSDGFGIVYLDGKSGDFRTLNMDLGYRLLTTETRPYVAHCRYTTVGETNADGIHPFPIGKGRYLFQNGTITTDSKSKSDTYQLAETLHGLSSKRVSFLLTAFDSCRWAVVDTKHKTAETFGTWHTDNGIEYSKDNVLKPETLVSSYGGYSCGYYDTWDTPAEYNTAADTSKRTTLAVYGTLRYGFGNHGLIKDADFIGYAYTANKMRLCINGLPYMIRGKHKDGRNVECELYSVDNETLSRVDQLEGHPTFYRRDLIAFKLDSSITGHGGNISAACYMVDASYDNGVYHASY